MSQFPSQDLLRAASGVAGLPLGPGVNPASPKTPATLGAMAWGYYPDDTIYIVIVTTYGQSCVEEYEIHHPGDLSQVYHPGSNRGEVYHPGTRKTQRSCE